MSRTVRWADIEQRPVEFPPEEHPIGKVTGLQTALDARERVANRNQPNGYAGLGADGTLPQTQVANLAAALDRLDAIGDARWAVDHVTWPDGTRITPVEKANAAATLRDDRIARSRPQGG